MRFPLVLMALLAALLAPPATRAWQALALDIGRVSGATWSAEGVRLEWRDDGTLELGAERLRLPRPVRVVEDLTVSCPGAELTPTRARCAEGRMELVIGGSRAVLELGFERLSERFELTIGGPLPGAARAELTVAGDGAGWRAALTLAAREVSAALAALFTGTQAWPIAFSAGQAGLEVTVSGEASGEVGALRGEARLEASRLAFSDEAGTQAAEGLGFVARARAARDGSGGAAGDWRFETSLELDAGGVYVAPLYLEPGTGAHRLEAEGRWQPGGQRLDLERVALAAPGPVAVEAEAVIGLGAAPALESLRLRLPRTRLVALYPRYLKPFLVDSVVAELELGGEVEGELIWAGGEPRAGWLELHGVGMADPRERLALAGLAGRIHLGGGEETRLRWSEGRLYALSFGAAELRGRLAERAFSLAAPVQVPVLDGVVKIEGLEVRDLGADPEWRLSASVGPLSVEALTRTLGWPVFTGTLAGRAPAVRYADGVLAADGDLVVRIFDGEVRVAGLALERPLGPVPVLRADIDVRGLSLDALTRTFAFGNIKGRIDGHVRDLVLQDWQPLAFDAAFATPEDDRSRHRISQDAVDNLARLGGGRDVLATTFLRFFDEFSYDRLGIRCRLRNGVCEMGGVEPAAQGYYIVKGGGWPPRVDVIGYNERVDWAVLIERLGNVTERPVIR